MPQELQNILSKIVKFGLYAILLTPLAFWPRALYGFMTPKFVLFQVLVEIVFGAWLALIALGNTNTRMRANDTNTEKEYSRHSYWRKWLIIALTVFIGASFLSAVFGVDFSRSVWGIGARMTGLFAELHFFAWFLMLFTVFSNTNTQIGTNNTNKNIGNIRMPFINSYYYLNFSFAISVLVALTALYQNTGWHIVYGNTFFGNPTFAAPYFLFHFFWGLYQIYRHPMSVKKYICIGGSALILWALLLGQIRGALIGLILGILFLFIGLTVFNIFKSKIRIVIGAALALMVLSVGLFWQYKDADLIKKSYLDRFSDISISDATIQTRLLTWRAAFSGLKTAGGQLFLGVGPENFNYLFNKNYNPRLLMYGGSSFAETWQDKPHNAFIEILTEVGIIGGAAYILIWLCVIYCLFKIFKKEEKILSLSLAAAFISYFGALFFSFDSFGSWFGLFLTLGFLASYNNTNGANQYANDTNKSFVKNIFVLFVCVGLFVLLYVNYGIWRANSANANALRAFPVNPAASIELFKKSLSYKSPYKSEYQFDLIASVGGAIEKGIPLKDLEDTINFVLNEADKAVFAHPDNASAYTDMLRIYNILGTNGRDPEILRQAEIFGSKSLELSPNRQETIFYLARTALLKNDASSAVQLTLQAVEIDPEIDVSHWYLGLAFIADNQERKGVSEIKKALGLGYQPQNQTEKDFLKSLGL